MSVSKEIYYLLSKYKTDKKPKRYSKSSKKFLKGSINLFSYPNPKYAKQLPYYDTNPMVLILDYDGEYILGINLHYIPWTRRIEFAKKVIKKLKYKNRLKYSEIKRAAESVKMPGVFAYFSIRKYIRSRINGKIYSFNYENWHKAVVNIPANFKKKQDSFIYRDINKKVRELRKNQKK